MFLYHVSKVMLWYNENANKIANYLKTIKLDLKIYSLVLKIDSLL